MKSKKTCPEDFGRELVDKRLSIDKPVILIEGYTISLPKIRATIVKKLRERNVYIWNLTREAFRILSFERGFGFTLLYFIYSNGRHIF